MKLVSSKQHFECSIFKVTEDRATDRSGRELHRFIVRHGGSAVMMPVDDKKRVLLVRQYRLPADADLWELPAGRVDAGEKLLAAAKRELREETGYRARTWRKLVSFFASPGFVAEKMTIFLATDLTAGEAEPMEDEDIECRWFTAREIDAMIQSGKIIDAKTLIGFLAWKRYGS